MRLSERGEMGALSLSASYQSATLFYRLARFSVNMFVYTNALTDLGTTSLGAETTRRDSLAV